MYFPYLGECLPVEMLGRLRGVFSISRRMFTCIDGRMVELCIFHI